MLFITQKRIPTSRLWSPSTILTLTLTLTTNSSHSKLNRIFAFPLRSVCVPFINMHKSRVYDVTHCYNLGKMGWEKVPSCRLIKCLVSVFLHTSLVPSCTLFTAVLPKRLYKTPTPYIHYHPQDKTHRSHHGLIKRARQTPSLLTLSPFPLFFHWRSPLPFYLRFLFPSSQFLGLCSRYVSHFAT